jgi:hypothetical protein
MLDEDWMQKALHYMDHAPNAAFIFGKGAPIFETHKLIGSTVPTEFCSGTSVFLKWSCSGSERFFMLLAVFYEKKRSIN